MIHLEIQTVFNEIERLRDEMTQTLIDLIRIPAIGPESDGEGEIQKSERLVQICKAIGFDEVQNYDASDGRPMGSGTCGEYAIRQCRQHAC